MKTLTVVFDFLFNVFSLFLAPLGFFLQVVKPPPEITPHWELMLYLLLGASASTYFTNKIDHLSVKEIYQRMVLAFGTGYAASRQFVLWMPEWNEGFIYMCSGFGMLFVFSIAFKFLKDFEQKKYLNRIFEQRAGLDDDEETQNDKDNDQQN